MANSKRTTITSALRLAGGIVLLLCWGVASAFDHPRMLVNADPGSAPGPMLATEQFLYFLADDGVHGRELWRLDSQGTASMVEDAAFGPASPQITLLASSQSTLLYAVRTEADRPVRLYCTDQAGIIKTAPEIPGFLPLAAVSSNNGFVVMASSPAHGTELWRVDCENERLVLLADTFEGDKSGVAINGAGFGSLQNGILFSAQSSQTGTVSLWTSDGTSQGTRPLSDGAGNHIINHLTTMDGAQLGARYVFARQGERPLAGLWITDGTYTGSQPLTAPNEEYPEVKGQFVATTSLAFFKAYTGQTGDELWCTDGTPSGTRLVADVFPGPQGSGAYAMTPAGELVVFAADHPDYGTELWASDGTQTGTKLVRDFLPGVSSSDPYSLTPFRGFVLFSCGSSDVGEELWRTDGTPEGTVLVKDINPGPANSEPYYLTEFNEKVYFEANHAAYGSELWETDGTAEGTRLAARIRPAMGLVQSSDPGDLLDLQGTLYFTARRSDRKRHILQIRPDSPRPENVLTLSQAQTVGDAEQLLLRDGHLIIRSAGEGHWWTYDPRTAQLAPLSEGPPPLPPSSLQQHLSTDRYRDWFSSTPAKESYIDMGDYTAFRAYRRATGAELYRLDHATGDVSLIRDIFPGTVGSGPAELTRIGDGFVFRAEDPNKGTELFASDGTHQGTWLVNDYRPTPSGSSPSELTVVEDRLFVVGRSNKGRFDIFNYQLPSLRLISNLFDDWLQERIRPIELCGAGEKLYFTADHAIYGTELWVTDGTHLNTRLVQDLLPNATFDPDSKAWELYP